MKTLKELLEVAFEKGGDWRMACKNLTDGKIHKLRWAESDDFEDTYSQIKPDLLEVLEQIYEDAYESGGQGEAVFTRSNTEDPVQWDEYFEKMVKEGKI